MWKVRKVGRDVCWWEVRKVCWVLLLRHFACYCVDGRKMMDMARSLERNSS